MNTPAPTKSFLERAFIMPSIGTDGLSVILYEQELPKGIVIAANYVNRLTSCMDPSPLAQVGHTYFMDECTERSENTREDAVCDQKEIYEHDIIEIDITNEDDNPAEHSMDRYASQSWGALYFPAGTMGGTVLGRTQDCSPENANGESGWLIDEMLECEENVLRGIDALLADE